MSPARDSAPGGGFKESSAEFVTHVMRRYMLALVDSVRILLHVMVAGFSGWLAFVLYYAPESFLPPQNLLLFFEASSIHYGKLSVLAGVIFSAVGFMRYGRGMNGPLDQQLQQLMSAWGISLLVVITILFLMKTGSDFSRGWMLIWAVLTPALLIVNLSVERLVQRVLRRIGFARRRLAIVGATPQASRFLERMNTDTASEGFDIIGVFHDHDPTADDVPDSLLPLMRGGLYDLGQLCRTEPIDAIVLAMANSESQRIADTVEQLMEVPADIFLGPDLAHFELGHRSGAHVGAVPVTSLTRLPMRDWAGIGKWLEDKVIVVAALFFLAPLLLLTAILIKLDSPGPVLFRQRRFGFNNTSFDVYKFRTMYVEQGDQSGATQTSRDDRRITRVGRFLRMTSIDELPQLINVWNGNMSIVGPRAHPVGMMVKDQPYHELVRHYAARHRVKPGITGLAQVNGNRGEVTTQEKAEKRVHYDLFYIENWSIWLDLSIILRTAIRLPFDRSAY